MKNLYLIENMNGFINRDKLSVSCSINRHGQVTFHHSQSVDRETTDSEEACNP